MGSTVENKSLPLSKKAPTSFAEFILASALNPSPLQDSLSVFHRTKNSSYRFYRYIYGEEDVPVLSHLDLDTAPLRHELGVAVGL